MFDIKNCKIVFCNITLASNDCAYLHVQLVIELRNGYLMFYIHFIYNYYYTFYYASIIAQIF